jgi:acetyl-CoA C-acetyltransferase
MRHDRNAVVVSGVRTPIGKYGEGLAAVPPVKALHELRRTGDRHALVTMCIGGGQGIAAVLERI